jgi:D-arabinose 1-dehydrogenase-like Zn-dependent alcohol dehydrogenase
MQAIRVCTYDGPGAKPVIRNVPWPKIPKKGALIKVGACGVCGTDLHILKGHRPKPLPWPFTLGHEIGGVLVEVGSEFCEDFMSKPLKVGSKVMIPPLQRFAARCRHALPHPSQISMVGDADDLSLHRGSHRPRGGRCDGDEDGEVDHCAVAGIGGVIKRLGRYGKQV